MNSISNVGQVVLKFLAQVFFTSNRRLYCNRQIFSQVSLLISSHLLKLGLCLGTGMVDSAPHVRFAGVHVLCSFQFPVN